MTDDQAAPAQPQPGQPLPQPQYGQYAPPGYQPPPQPQQQYPQYQYPAGPYDQTYLQPPGRKRQTWDLVLTISLLAVGLFGMAFGVFGGLNLEQALALGLDFQGGDVVYNLPPWVGAAGVFIAISHMLLYVAAVAISIPLLLRKRIAFWAPLGAGIVAAIIYHGTTFVIGLSSVDLTTIQ